MSPDERQMLAGLFQRISAMGGAPRDRDAEAMIGDAVKSLPFAPYVMAQTVLVQEQQLGAASARVLELEAQLRDMQSHAAPADSGGFLGSIGKSLFGGPAPAAPRPSAFNQPPQGGPWGQPQQPPQYQPAPQQYQPGPQYQQPMGAPQRSGGGFMSGALGAAAGLAGGVLMADSIKGMFGSHSNPLGDTAGSLFGGSHADAGGAQQALTDADFEQPAQVADATDSGSDSSGDSSADYGTTDV